MALAKTEKGEEAMTTIAELEKLVAEAVACNGSIAVYENALPDTLQREPQARFESNVGKGCLFFDVYSYFQAHPRYYPVLDRAVVQPLESERHCPTCTCNNDD